MRREDILKAMAALFSGIMIHEDLMDELSDVIQKSGFENKFFRLLLTRLKYLCTHGAAAVNYPEGFEALANKAEGLYSMRLIGKDFNIRILYAFLPDGSPVLLLGFAEKSGKKVTSYESHIPAAKERLKLALEAYNDEE